MEKPAITWRNPNTLIPYAKNSKIHNLTQIDNIAQQISAFGFDQPIVVDKEGVIIKGHARREAALRLGLEQVPVWVSNLSEHDAMAARIGDNKVAEAPWDNDMLQFEFGTLLRQDINLSQVTGFTDEEIKRIMDGWQTDLSLVDGTKENLDGITAVIKVSCPQEAREHVLAYLKEQISTSGFEGVTIE